jgi:hypothetical protein
MPKIIKKDKAIPVIASSDSSFWELNNFPLSVVMQEKFLFSRPVRKS